MAVEAVTIYAVVSGEYSDYRVLALFELREDAEKGVEVADASRDPNHYYVRVEEFDYYPAGGPPFGMEIH